MVTPIFQTLLAERPDGHTAAGLPGNCLQAAVASLLHLPLEEVPHFAVYVDWFAAMRRWARDRDGDFTYFPIPVPEEYSAAWSGIVAWADQHPAACVLLGGPSPRGPFEHEVVGKIDLTTVHDPHPSRAGLLEVNDVIVYCQPYDPPPITRELAR